MQQLQLAAAVDLDAAPQQLTKDYSGLPDLRTVVRREVAALAPQAMQAKEQRRAAGKRRRRAVAAGRRNKSNR